MTFRCGWPVGDAEQLATSDCGERFCPCLAQRKATYWRGRSTELWLWKPPFLTAARPSTGPLTPSASSSVDEDMYSLLLTPSLWGNELYSTACWVFLIAGLSEVGPSLFFPPDGGWGAGGLSEVGPFRFAAVAPCHSTHRDGRLAGPRASRARAQSGTLFRNWEAAWHPQQQARCAVFAYQLTRLQRAN